MNICVQICSKAEWAALKKILQIKNDELKTFPFGEYTEYNIQNTVCNFYNSGPTVTKSSAACQFVIDKWKPKIIIILGTCGGIAEDINVFNVIIANKTIYFNSIKSIYCENNFIYAPLTTIIDNSWINFNKLPVKIREGVIGTNDNFNNFDAAQELRKENVLGIDWESSAIAYVCFANKVKFCILRGVSDLLKLNDEVIINEEYKKNTPKVMEILLLNILPGLIQNI